jgi:hypothetical protein
MSGHAWGPKFRCLNDGCNIVRHAKHPKWWRHGWGRSLWRKDPIPKCTGKLAPDRCSHVERIPLALGPGQTVRGGIKVGQCERPALPRLVVCELHADPEAVRLAMRAMAEEIERLKQLSDTGRDN